MMDFNTLNHSRIVVGFFLVVFFLLLPWLGFRWFEHSSLYYPERRMESTPDLRGMAYEEAAFSTRDGKKLHGWFIPAVEATGQPGFTTGASGTVLFFNGNAGNISYRLDKAFHLRRLGLSVFLFDYRGYGQSQGWPTEKGTYRDGEAAYRYLRETRGIPPDSILLYGESLGAAVAVDLAIRVDTAGLILESAFTSVVAMANEIFPILPARWIVRYRYDSLSKVNKISVPVLFLHSRQDEIVPFRMGEALHAATQSPKTFFELRGGHNDAFFSTPDTTKAIGRWLADDVTTKR